MCCLVCSCRAQNVFLDPERTYTLFSGRPPSLVKQSLMFHDKDIGEPVIVKNKYVSSMSLSQKSPLWNWVSTVSLHPTYVSMDMDTPSGTSLACNFTSYMCSWEMATGEMVHLFSDNNTFVVPHSVFQQYKENNTLHGGHELTIGTTRLAVFPDEIQSGDEYILPQNILDSYVVSVRKHNGVHFMYFKEYEQPAFRGFITMWGILLSILYVYNDTSKTSLVPDEYVLFACFVTTVWFDPFWVRKALFILLVMSRYFLESKWLAGQCILETLWSCVLYLYDKEFNVLSALIASFILFRTNS